MLGVKGSRGEAGNSASAAPSLQNGDQLRSQEFLRRFEAMPELRKAELIEGVVYMGSPVSAEDHGEPDALIHTWLGTYAAHTAGTRLFANTTVLLDPANAPQPDACLCLTPNRGGRTRIVPRKYISGPPELIAEIAASSVSIDLHDKMDAYARNGVGEYLVWRTLEQRFDWFNLEAGQFRRKSPDARQLVRSQTFPGLVLDVRALLDRDAAKVLAVLQRGLSSGAHRAFAAQLTAGK